MRERCAIMLIACGAGCCVLRANDVYIAQNSAGSANGASCSSAFAMTYFNTAGNWSSNPSTGAKIGPGTTVHLCGTFNAPAGANGFLAFQRGGTSGNPITLVAEPGLLMQAPYWGLGGAIAASETSWVTLNGMNNGTIQATANGTRLANQAPACTGAFCGAGISLVRCDNCVVQNWTIANIYVNVPPNDESLVADTMAGIFYNSGNNVIVSGNTVHDAKWCVMFGYWPGETTRNVRIYSNTLYNCDHGVAVYSDNSGAVLNDLYIYGNTIHDAVNWDDNLNHNHHDGIHISPVQNNTQLHNVYIYNNYIYGDWGGHCNAFVYLEGPPDPATALITNANVFNNLLVNASPAHTCANGLIQDFSAQDTLIANNTLIGPSSAHGTAIISEEVLPHHTNIKNNVISGFEYAFYIGQGNALPASDYNDFNNVANMALVWGTDCCGAIQQWHGKSGSPDAHSIRTNPNLSSSYAPQAGSPAIRTGTNLTSVGLASLNSDKAGVQRPAGVCAAAGASGCWDLGAYQSGGGNVPATPNQPARPDAQVH
jgi:hypothetical protein